jgi:hypothetical protein
MIIATMKRTTKIRIRIYQPKLKGLGYLAKGLPTWPFMMALATSEEPLFTPIHIKLFS